MKIAIIPTTGGTDPYKGMEIAVELGVEGVHLPALSQALGLAEKSSAERADVLKRIHGLGLEVSALIGWGGRVDLGEEENLAENIAEGKRINEIAVDIAGGVWMAHVGIMPDDDSDPKWARFVDSLGQIAEHGAGIGATLALETGPEPPVVVRKMMEQVNSPSLRVNFDPGNLILWPPNLAKRKNVPYDLDAAMRDFDPVEGLRTLIPYVAHVHAKDAMATREGERQEVPLGTGMANWPELHRIFQENGYEGYYAIERECGESAMEDVKNAVEFLRGL
ncbi:MAG: sugar phosphate isomerase/epimerase [Lentisphaerae bacterium]|nr:sugar phosphate isomerase/epimerase [Lentisphaerota bacterium]MBT4816483.1 sugar phosphate isomerase/epimerase [Lentisphaerota bacterium]MBT5612034.1 sugar phosphate isomerase/epimerase [Lentisphaerota bacterium]MBT7054782.1 sugar phosphate isomerase/epimerase [Lentisphaerota bacterium]MBT7846373.1 sugar phosphate isomerase/epimerase [Lentisphaerota bacterium]